jgi:hypothetical protein
MAARTEMSSAATSTELSPMCSLEMSATGVNDLPGGSRVPRACSFVAAIVNAESEPYPLASVGPLAP